MSLPQLDGWLRAAATGLKAEAKKLEKLYPQLAADLDELGDELQLTRERLMRERLARERDGLGGEAPRDPDDDDEAF